MLTTENIINKQFAPAGRGVYNSQEVDDFIRAVAASVDRLSSENAELIKKISILADKVEEYRRDEEAITASLLTAHRMSESIRNEANESAQSQLTLAQSKSRTLVEEAEKQAQEITDEAKASAKDIVVNAREAVAAITERSHKEYDEAISEATAKAEAIVADAEARGKKIVGDSEEKFAFYQGELNKALSELDICKEAITKLCNDQLKVVAMIPAPYVAPEAVSEPVVAAQPEVAQETYFEPDAFAAESIIEETEQIEAPQDINSIPGLFAPADEEPEVEQDEIEIADDDDDDEFIDDIFDDIDEEPEPVDDREIDADGCEDGEAPSFPVPETDEQQIELDDLEDDFTGFKVDLDEMDDAESSDDDDDDDDISSLFKRF